MKALYNGTCATCGRSKPRCATVYVRSGKTAGAYLPSPQVMCQDCRRTRVGGFRSANQHR